MKCTITEVETKKSYEYSADAFCKRFASFLMFYERHKTEEELDTIFARCNLAITQHSIFLYESNGFKFMALPERR